GLLAWPGGQLHQLLETHDRGFSERVRRLLAGEYYLPYLPGLLHGDIDIDRADFLKRDTQQCGVAYGNYDLSWLISTCAVGRTAEGALVIGFDRRKALRVVEHFLTARRALYENVYYHKTVHAAEGMVSLFLGRLKEVIGQYADSHVEGLVRPLVRMIEGHAVPPEELLSLDDFSLSVLIDSVSKLDGMDATVRDLGRRIIDRDLFKVVPASPRKVRDFLMAPSAFERLYAVIRRYAPGEPRYYLYVDRYSFEMLAGAGRSCSYFVDDSLSATPIRDHEALRQYWTEPEESIRLFSVREAVRDLAAVIE
ncbi:MAG TPA: hypothetical protein VFW33_22045, partial [Gemmataceae bacterium]|nr:hypothetical protein [Gemmataceae bacterium]